MLASDSFVFEEYQILGNQKLLPHPKTDASILLNISQLPSNGKFQTKLHSQKVTNLAPENRPTPTFSGAVLSNSRGWEQLEDPGCIIGIIGISTSRCCERTPGRPRNPKASKTGFCCWCFFWGGIRYVDVAGTCLWVLCVWWNLVLAFVDVIFGWSLIVYLVQYPINGSIDVIGTFQNEWFWNVSSGPSSNNTFWGEVG